MLISGASSLSNTLRRIGLWFGSLLLGVTLFSLLFAGTGSVAFIFRITMTFAFPVGCLFLPFVIALRDAEQRRIWTILSGGFLIGPLSIAFWGIILQLKGGDPHTIWRGDALAGGGGDSCMIFALIVGFLTTCFYVIALRVLCRWPASTRMG